MQAATTALRWVARGVGALAFADLQVWGRALGWLVGDALQVRRAHVLSAMRHAGLGDPERAASSMYASLGTSALELLWMAGRTRELAAIAEVELASGAIINNARSLNRGVVFAASHTGNWDLAACAIARQIPLMIVTKRLSVRGIDEFWQGARQSYGITLVEARGAMAKASAHLTAGGAVAMMIDQVPNASSHAERATFLGQSAHIDRAAFTLAARAGAPLLVPVALRTPRGQSLRIVATFTPPDSPTQSWARATAREATPAPDLFVREHPSEWLWMHRRWRAPPHSRVDVGALQRSK